LIHFID